MAVLPNKSQVHIDRPLSNILVSNLDQDGTLVANSLFPEVPSAQQSNMYFKIPQGAFLKSRAMVRAPQSETPGITYTVDPNNRFNCLVRGVHTVLDDQTLANQDSPINLLTTSTKLLGADLVLGEERDFMNAFMRPGIWKGFSPSGTPVDFDPTQAYSHGQWDLTNSDPIRDVRYLCTQMQGRTGKKPNKMVMGKNVYEALCNNPSVYARKQYVSESFLDAAWLAKAFQVDTVIVADTVLNTAEEGQADNTGFITANSFLLCYAAPQAGLYVPSAGYKFRWTNYSGANGLAGVVRQWREEKLRATWLEAETCYDYRVVCEELGIFGTNLLKVP